MVVTLVRQCKEDLKTACQMADNISKLQAQGSGKKRAEDNGRRLDSLEGQIQIQNNEAK